MELSQLLAMELPKAATIGATVISAVAAISAAVVSYLNSRAVERVKANYQQELEEQKAGYQQDLERRKNELQSELEGRKLGLQKELEQFKSGLTDELAAQNARRAYEYDAKKRLYEQVEPLLFQLFEAAEGAFHAVTSLARTQRKDKLPEWLAKDEDEYYIHSIMHRLFLPLAIFRLIQRSTTLVDLNLDPSIRLRYALLKQAYLTWTDDFGMAEVAPELTYSPNENDWEKKRNSGPAIYWRQGLVIGGLDRLVDAMIVENSSPTRPMNFGEWDLAVSKNAKLKPAYENVEDIFVGFDFRNRPVLGRILVSYACMMHALMSVYGKTAADIDLIKLISELPASEEVNGLRWWTGGQRDFVAEIIPYVLKRTQQAVQGGYAKF